MNNEKEKRANEEERLGKYREFNSVEELLADLHQEVLPLTCPWCGLVLYPDSATDTHCMGNK